MVKIRDFEERDRELVLEIAREAFVGYTTTQKVEEKFGRSPGEKSWQESLAEHIVQAIDADTSATLVAEEDGVVVGFMLHHRWDPRKGAIGYNAVSPSHQRRGIGNALIRESLKRLKEKGIQFVRVETMECDIPAQRLYEKAGFEKVYGTVHYMQELRQ